MRKSFELTDFIFCKVQKPEILTVNVDKFNKINYLSLEIQLISNEDQIHTYYIFIKGFTVKTHTHRQNRRTLFLQVFLNLKIFKLRQLQNTILEMVYSQKPDLSSHFFHEIYCTYSSLNTFLTK